MSFANTARIAACALPLMLSSVTDAATRPGSSVDANTVVVEASGNVPGFTPTQLVTYLARRMQEENADSWQFSTGKPGAAPAPNRVVWSFKTLRVVWKGGAHRGFSSQENSVSYLSAEVKLYLRSDYQMMMVTHPSLSGGFDDKALSQMVHDVAHVLFVENKPDLP